MSSPLLVALLQELDARQHILARLDSYYQGRSPASFMSANDKKALAKFDAISANVCRASVLAVQERLRVSGYSGPDVWDLWTANNLDQLHSSVGHRDALLYGGCGAYAICWASPDGRPVVTLESAKRVHVRRNPVTGEIVAAVKRVRDTVAGTTKAWLYLPDRVEYWASNSAGADSSSFQLRGVLEHHLETVPVVAIGLEDDASVIADILSLQDALNKYLLDSLVASEYSGRPRRYATGISAVKRQKVDPVTGEGVTDDDGNPVMELVPPFGESNRFMIAQDPNASIGQLPSADLSGFTEGIRAILAMVEMSTGLPPHYMGQISTAAQPSSADAIRGSEAALVSRAEARQASYGPAWETVLAMLVAIRDGLAVDEVAPIRVKWAPADTRSQAQEADAIVKLVAANILPITYALQKLGYDADEIAEIRAARRAETLDAQAVDLGAITAAPTAETPPADQ